MSVLCLAMAGNNYAMQNDANIALVPVERDLDVTSVGELRCSIDQLIERGCLRIILNMTAVGYIDSAGMGLIIHEIARMRSAGGLLSLTNVSRPVLRSLTLARVIDYVPVSVMGAKRDIPELDPSVQPLWRWAFRVDASDLAATRAKVARLLDRIPFTADEHFDMALAVGEAMGNAVDHCGGTSLVSIAGFPDRAIVEISDCGCGFKEPAGQGVAVGEWDERGRGIKLMRLLADSVSFSRKCVGTGTVVRLVKLADGRRAHDARETTG